MSKNSPEFVKGLGLTSAITLVMGSMIGSGIFIVSADIARTVASPSLLIAAWLITAFLTIVGALAYGELAAMMPQAGGQYVFLRESLGSIWGFLYGWTLFLVIQTGTIAAVAIAFGKFLGVFFPQISADAWIVHFGGTAGINTQNLVAIAVIVFLTWVNVRGVKTGALVQNVFTFAKTAALIGIIVVGVFVGRNADAIAQNFGAFWTNFSWNAQFPISVGSSGTPAVVGVLTVLAIVQVGSLFSSDAWNNVTFAAAEVKNPQRNLPLSLAIGTGSVLFLYVVVNFIYLSVLPLVGDPAGATPFARGIQYASSDRVATAVLEELFSTTGAKAMAFAILISTFGCVNGLILSGARVFFAMSRDQLFFKRAGELHPKYKTPTSSLIFQGIWAALLCLSGTYGQLLDYTIFAAVLFYILTIYGLFVLRRTRPDAPRPYRAIGYPVLPAIYIALAIFIDAVLLIYKPQYTWPGVIIVLLGVPVYFLWRKKSTTSAVS